MCHPSPLQAALLATIAQEGHARAAHDAQLAAADSAIEAGLERLRQLLDEGAPVMSARVVDQVCRVGWGGDAASAPPPGESTLLAEMLAEVRKDYDVAHKDCP